MGVKSCKGCKWHDDFSAACCNGESEHRGDFTDNGCERYEPKSGVECPECGTDCLKLSNVFICRRCLKAVWREVAI